MRHRFSASALFLFSSYVLPIFSLIVLIKLFLYKKKSVLFLLDICLFFCLTFVYFFALEVYKILCSILCLLLISSCFEGLKPTLSTTVQYQRDEIPWERGCNVINYFFLDIVHFHALVNTCLLTYIIIYLLFIEAYFYIFLDS